MNIYHIVLPEAWEHIKSSSIYEADSLKIEGFIHCSYAPQVDAVLERYYRDAEKVVILEIDTGKLTSRLVEEPSTNNEGYPHIFGVINTDSIVGYEVRELDSQTSIPDQPET